jgi:prophage regulatory protein
MSAILRLPSVKNKTGLGRSTIYLLIAKGDFPKPISLGLRAVGFLENEIDAWIAGRVERSRAAEKTELTPPAVHEEARSPAAAFAEPSGAGRYASLRMHMGPGLGARTAQR